MHEVDLIGIPISKLFLLLSRRPILAPNAILILSPDFYKHPIISVSFSSRFAFIIDFPSDWTLQRENISFRHYPNAGGEYSHGKLFTTHFFPLSFFFSFAFDFVCIHLLAPISKRSDTEHTHSERTSQLNKASEQWKLPWKMHQRFDSLNLRIETVWPDFQQQQEEFEKKKTRKRKKKTMKKKNLLEFRQSIF